MTPLQFVDKIEELFSRRGNEPYGGEAVTQLEHALQSAALAATRGGDELVVASLLHDIGHLIHGYGDDCAERGIDDRHEELGVRFLAKFYPPSITEPIRLHVPAKRYLCSTDSAYFGILSEPSIVSLHLQGGPMNPAEVAEFERHPHYEAAVLLRRCDDEAKIPDLQTPPISTYRPTLEKCLANPA